MFVNVRPAVSSRPWVAAGVALALMFSLMAVMAPAIATEPQPSVAFVDPGTELVLDEGKVTFSVAVTGEFDVDAAVLANGVSGIEVEVQLTSPADLNVEPASESVLTIDGEVPTATVALELGDDLADETYVFQAEAFLLDLLGVRLEPSVGGDQVSLDYLNYPDGVIEDIEVAEGGFGASVKLDDDGRVFLGLLGDDFLMGTECPGEHTRLPNTVFFDIIVDEGGAQTAEVTVTLTKDLRQEDVNNGLAAYQFCYLGGAEFTDRDGNLQTDTTTTETGLLFSNLPKLSYGPALLPECKDNGRQAPCVSTRSGRGGGAQFTLLVPTGDPMFR